MGVLKINCFCEEYLMEDILNYISGYLSDTDHLSLSDIDRDFDNVRVCIDFDTYMDSVKIKSAEILDHDWDLLYEDTAVLNSRLRTVVDEYNRNHAELRLQACHIRNEYIY